MQAVQVFLDDRGGGPAHVTILERALSGRVACLRVPLKPRDLSWSPLGWIESIRRVARVTNRRSIVHAHGTRAAVPALVAASFRRAPLVVTVHGLHVARAAGGRPRRALARFVLRRASLVLCLSASDARAVTEGRYARPDRVRAITPATDHRGAPPGEQLKSDARSALGVDPDAFVALWMGRLEREKDPATFVRALARLPTGSGICGLVVGDGTAAGDIRRLSAELPPGRIRVTGWLSDPSPALAAADVFVSTSRWEGAALAVVEAAGAGLPAILTDAPGLSDVVADGLDAVLVPPGDDSALARALLGKMRANPEDAGRRRRQAAQWAARFTPERLAADVFQAYRDVAAS